MPVPDIQHTELMIGVYRRDSITEMSERTGLSLAGVHGKLRELEENGLVNPPRKPRAARDRTLTKAGEDYLRANGYIQTKLFPT